MVNEWYGWKGRILRVDLSKEKIIKQDLPEDLAKSYIGCRGINAKILYDDVGPDIDAFDPENEVVFGTGPLDGTPVGMGRVSIATKGKTGLFCEGGFGGFFGPELKFAGYDHIVIKGKARKPVYLWIDDGDIEVMDASIIWGKTTWETDKILKEEIGDPNIQVAYIGPAGENVVHASSVFTSLNHSGCRGCGTVMGAKNLKAIAVRGSGGVQVADPDEFWKSYESMREILRLDGMDNYLSVYGVFGAPSQMRIFNEIGFLSTNNAQDMHCDYADEISGERYLEKYVKGPRACFCCFTPSCGKSYEVKDGPYAGTKGENLWAGDQMAFTSLMGINYLPAALKARSLCNQLGLDVFHAGYTIAWAMECYEKGLITKKDTGNVELRFGNHSAMIEMIEKIAYREGFGDILAEGSEEASRKIKKGTERYTLTIKGKELEMMPQRNFYVGALGLAISESGPDHTRWYPPYPSNPAIITPKLLKKLNVDIDLTNAFKTREKKGKGKLLKFLEDSRAALESIPSCVFAPRGILGLDFRLWTSLLEAGTGAGFKYDGVMLAGERIRNVERAFIVRAGYRREHDTIPRRMREDPLPSVGIPPLKSEDLDFMLDEYYEARGWDKKTAIPTREKLEKLGLKYIADEFAKLAVR